ncbi:hypothetical protein IE53DRAFT_199979 [Violaceomyces palustris]|uniref:Uncharacterized protein n=1 Tax=Violaceomyces palustris TaxID=1673888 RepID=A0ACD0NRC7_9BASI|nr:hypothetical protein IE53DRAFT_199979 [Violaceomyces palustris]
MPYLLSRRTSSILLTLLALFLVGTVIVLSTVNAYFSIDSSAYILPEELGTWEEIQLGNGADVPSGWLSKHPWVAKMLHKGDDASLIGASPDQDPLAAMIQPGRDNSPTPVNDPSKPPEKIPRIIHQTWKDSNLPPRWKAVRDECAAMHPDYEYMLWSDADSRQFLVDNYSWFVPVFDAYPYAIQRADAIRYFVLHHYGGIYMDLDIGCLRRLDDLLRFEVILPKTIPVGVSNDVMLSQKGHPFMEQVIHNLVTFNHQYLSNYPTVMFSTGPMFVSASYGIYVDAHGPAIPSTPSHPSAGFEGVRVLPKSLYGKNAKPSEAPDAFFKHFYGSSWHSNDAGFLIFLRDHGRFMMFIGACIVAYGAFKTMLPRIVYAMGERGGVRRRPNDRGGRWISLPVGTSVGASVQRHRSGRRRSTLERQDGSEHTTGASSSSAARLSMPAPRAHRLSLPLFQLQENETTATHPPQSVLAWVGSSLSRPSSRGDGISEVASSAFNGTRTGADGSRMKKKTGGILYLPAYFVGRGDDNASQQMSPSSSSSISSPPSWQGHSGGQGSLGKWVTSLLPANWRGPSPAPSSSSRLSRGGGDDIDLESMGTASSDEEADLGGSELRRRGSSNFGHSESEGGTPMARNTPANSAIAGPAGGRFTKSWADEKTAGDKPGTTDLNSYSASPSCYDVEDPLEAYGGGRVGEEKHEPGVETLKRNGSRSRSSATPRSDGTLSIGPGGTLLVSSRRSSGNTQASGARAGLLKRIPSNGDLTADEDTPLRSNSPQVPPPPYQYGNEIDGGAEFAASPFRPQPSVGAHEGGKKAGGDSAHRAENVSRQNSSKHSSAGVDACSRTSMSQPLFGESSHAGSSNVVDGADEGSWAEGEAESDHWRSANHSQAASQDLADETMEGQLERV